jgi:acyl carrier protein
MTASAESKPVLSTKGSSMLERKQIADAVLAQVAELLEEEKIPVADLTLQSGLLESGLDSLAFAVVLTRLEESLGFDPFLTLEDEVFPRTLGELVDVYYTYQEAEMSQS